MLSMPLYSAGRRQRTGRGAVSTCRTRHEQPCRTGRPETACRQRAASVERSHRTGAYLLVTQGLFVSSPNTKLVRYKGWLASTYRSRLRTLRQDTSCRACRTRKTSTQHKQAGQQCFEQQLTKKPRPAAPAHDVRSAQRPAQHAGQPVHDAAAHTCSLGNSLMRSLGRRALGDSVSIVASAQALQLVQVARKALRLVLLAWMQLMTCRTGRTQAGTRHTVAGMSAEPRPCVHHTRQRLKSTPPTTSPPHKPRPARHQEPCPMVNHAPAR